MDLLSFKMSLGKIVIELFDEVAPRTCENFRRLCLADNEKKLSYAGCRFAPAPPRLS